MRTTALIGMTVALSVLLGCSTPAVSAQTLKSDKPRDPTPQVAQADLNMAVQGNTDFALHLYQTVKSAEGNMFFSPYSISEAVAMTWAGAREQTESAIADAMSFKLDQSKLHPALNKLDIALSSRGANAQGKDGAGFRLRVVNAIWGQTGYSFTGQFLDTLAINYGAGLRLMDFTKNPEGSRETINSWVSEQTEQRIKDLIPSGSINNYTRLVLTNAIYFNAAWQHKFEKNLTAPATFTKTDGSQVTVPMMHNSADLSYSESEAYQAVAMPYDGRQLSMLIVMPKAGKFADLEKSLDSTMVAKISNSLTTKRVQLSMPKFKFEQSLGLKQVLTTMGMGVAFTDAADFSGMDGKRDLRIQDVLHKAYVSVDEDGTEAAAASAVVVGTVSMPTDIVEMKVDQPFVFLIRDDATGIILFIGRVMDPTK